MIVTNIQSSAAGGNLEKCLSKPQKHPNSGGEKFNKNRFSFSFRGSFFSSMGFSPTPTITFLSVGE